MTVSFQCKSNQLARETSGDDFWSGAATANQSCLKRRRQYVDRMGEKFLLYLFLLYNKHDSAAALWRPVLPWMSQHQTLLNHTRLFSTTPDSPQLHQTLPNYTRRSSTTPDPPQLHQTLTNYTRLSPTIPDSPQLHQTLPN